MIKFVVEIREYIVGVIKSTYFYVKLRKEIKENKEDDPNIYPLW